MIRRAARASAFYCLLAWAALRGTGGKKSKNDTATAVPMPGHSFTPPLFAEELLHDWLVGGAAIFDRKHLLLQPAVPERFGALWSKNAVKTGNFEVTVHFRVVGDEAPAADASMALWYVSSTASQKDDYGDSALAAGYHEAASGGVTFSGSQAKFTGVGAVLTSVDASKTARSVVSFVHNDGQKGLEMGIDAPAKNAKAVDFRNTLNNAQLRLRVSPTTVEGYMKLSPSLSWQGCFRIDRSTDKSVSVPANGYIGITSWSGTGEKSAADQIFILQVDVTNFDDTAVGEEIKDVSTKIQDAYREMLTDENRHFVDQRSQMEHLRRLTSMLADHVTEAKPADEKLHERLNSLNDRMDRLDYECRTLSKEVEVLVNPAAAGGAGEVKDGIIGLRTLLVKGFNMHKETVDRVSGKIKDVKTQKAQAASSGHLKTISVQSETLERTVKKKASATGWTFFILICCVVIVGMLMYNRMHYYEKKHFV